MIIVPCWGGHVVRTFGDEPLVSAIGFIDICSSYSITCHIQKVALGGRPFRDTSVSTKQGVRRNGLNKIKMHLSIIANISPGQNADSELLAIVWKLWS